MFFSEETAKRMAREAFDYYEYKIRSEVEFILRSREPEPDEIVDAIIEMSDGNLPYETEFHCQLQHLVKDVIAERMDNLPTYRLSPMLRR